MEAVNPLQTIGLALGAGFSSGFEHAVVKRQDGKLSICETVVTELGAKKGFDVTCFKDGRIFDSFEDYGTQLAVLREIAKILRS